MSNPLLATAGIPEFSAISPAHVLPALDEVIAVNEARIRDMVGSVGAPTWDNFAAALEAVHERLNRAWSPVSHLHSVADTPALREAYNVALASVSAYAARLGQDRGLLEGWVALHEAPGFADLDEARQRIVTNAIRDLRLSGVALEGDARDRFRAIEERLAALSARFSENVLDATQSFGLHGEDPADLVGLPEAAEDAARAAAARAGQSGYRIGLDAPSYIAFMTHADRRDLRARLYEAFVTRASDQGPDAGRFDNTVVMQEILALRHEKAQLLGFRNFAEYALQTRMAKSVEAVDQFLMELSRHALPAARIELADLAAFAQQEAGIDQLEPWDIAWVSDRLRRARYSFSQEELRPWFPVDRVLSGLFWVAGEIFGIQVSEQPAPSPWHADVRYFEVSRDGAPCATFFLDLYAREGKRSGAWMDECLSRWRRTEGTQLPVAHLVCNFSPPAGGKPSLLTHEEVVTLFHEFGHGLHHMLTRIDYPAVSGINGVAWDAVELPSQFMENFCTERAVLDRLSGHFETGAPLPDELLEKLVAARNFQAGLQCVRQIEFALFDLRLHAEFDPAGATTVQQLLDEVRREVAVIQPPAWNRFQHSFSHVFAGGYAAGYYSYKWAEVLSADAFSLFEERGVLDAATGRAFLSEVLERGGSRDPEAMFRAFRGRAPSIEALLRHDGLMD